MCCSVSPVSEAFEGCENLPVGQMYLCHVGLVVLCNLKVCALYILMYIMYVCVHQSACMCAGKHVCDLNWVDFVKTSADYRCSAQTHPSQCKQVK